jgi:hypothetical protein
LILTREEAAAVPHGALCDKDALFFMETRGDRGEKIL